MKTIVKTYSNARSYDMPHFFVLCKGNNAGKPSKTPYPNSFVVMGETHHDKEQLQWLCYALWQAGHFRHHLIGSVIPFIRIEEFRKILTDALEKAIQRPQQFEQTIATLQKLNRAKDRIVMQLSLMDQIKQITVYQLIRSTRSN